MRSWLSHLLPLRHQCPVCQHRVADFLPLPRLFEENARHFGYPHFGRGESINVAHYSCPHCGASDRERFYALYLKEKTAASGGRIKPRMLHFAPENALSAMIRHSGLFEYRTADLNTPDVDDQVDISRMDIYPDAAFDVFICSHVLEHVPDDMAAMRELHRILKPGGWGILMVPLMTHFENTVEDPSATTEADRWRLFGQGDHVRLYAKQGFLRRIRSCCFQVTQLGMAHFGKSVFDRCGITPSSVLYVVRHD